MSPAGSGQVQFRGGFGAPAGRRRTSGWAWALPFLLPVGLAGMVALISLSDALGYLLAAVWGWIVFPCIAVYARRRSPSAGGDDDAQYWQTRMM
jgi:hypothetical protein